MMSKHWTRKKQGVLSRFWRWYADGWGRWSYVVRVHDCTMFFALVVILLGPWSDLRNLLVWVGWNTFALGIRWLYGDKR